MPRSLKELTLPIARNLPAIEKFLEELNTSPRVDLRLEQTENAPIGAKIAQLQTLLSARRSERFNVIVRDEAEKPGIRLTPLEIAAIRTADRSYRSSDRLVTQPSVISNAIKSTDFYSGAIESTEPISEYWILIPDNTSQSFPKLLYSSPEILKESEAYYVLITKAVSRLMKYAEIPAKAFQNSFRRSIADVVYELFKNTHQWARTDWNGVRLNRSVRVIHIRAVKALTPVGNTFCDSISDFLNRRHDAVGYIEISVLDSGPGLAQRFAQKPLQSIASLDEEYGIIQKCMAVHATTSMDLQRGIGLHAVLKAVDEVRGYFRIRTGRLSLYRDTASNRYTESTSTIMDKFAKYIQAAVLRAANPVEMDYRLSPKDSADMREILEVICNGADCPTGEAAPEFILALASARLQLARPDEQRIVNLLDQKVGSIPDYAALIRQIGKPVNI